MKQFFKDCRALLALLGFGLLAVLMICGGALMDMQQRAKEKEVRVQNCVQRCIDVCLEKETCSVETMKVCRKICEE